MLQTRGGRSHAGPRAGARRQPSSPWALPQPQGRTAAPLPRADPRDSCSPVCPQVSPTVPGTGKTHDQRPRAARRPRPRTQPSADGASPASFARGFQGNLPSLPQTPSTVTGQTRPRRPLKHKPPPDACRWRGAVGPAGESGTGTGPEGLLLFPRVCPLPAAPGLGFTASFSGAKKPATRKAVGAVGRGCDPGDAPSGAGSPGPLSLGPAAGSSPTSGRRLKDKCTNQQTGSMSTEGPALAEGGRRGRGPWGPRSLWVWGSPTPEPSNALGTLFLLVLNSPGTSFSESEDV